MQVKKTIIKLIVLAAVALPYAGFAQTSSINAFSPYSMYGIGELSTQGVLSSRSMGGMGVAMRNQGVINMFNPAALSMARQKSFLFNFGLEGQNYYNSQVVGDATKKSAYNTFNFHDIAFQLPIAKGIGLGFSLTPYSNVGYRMQRDQIDGNVGWGNYVYTGEGDVTEVKFGVGWEPFKNFSIGAAMQYYWGDITRSFSMTPTNIVDNTTIPATNGIDSYSISSIKGQVGMQLNILSTNKRVLTLGAAYTIGGDLNPEVSKRVSVGNSFNSVVKGDTTHISLVLPTELNTGVVYQTPKWVVGVDYVFRNWGSRNKNKEMSNGGFEVAYKNTSTVKLGVEFTPDRYDVRRFYKRWAYRAGLRYGGYNQTFAGHNLSEYAVTAGIGIPLKFLGVSAIDVGVEYGGRFGSGDVAKRVGLVKQQYFKFALGFTIFAGAENNEYWFLRPKYD